MNRNDVIDVLTAVAAADRRTVGHADVDVWQAVIGDLPKEPALHAVRDHLREQPGVWLEPGHIYQRARVLMRDRLEREPAELREARQAALDAKAAADNEDRAHWVGPPKHSRPVVNSLMTPCPHCGARPGGRCVVPGTTRPPYGGMHPARIAQALDTAPKEPMVKAHD
jgi:hypothetical protein